MTLRTLDALYESGLLPQDKKLEEVVSRYAVAVTPAMASLIETARDPIGAQFLPDIRELIQSPDEIADPTADEAHSPVKGIVHRYPDRVLLKLLHICPVYCRFCFRRENVGPDGAGTLTSKEEKAALAYIASHSAIWEVILTGGDPLMLSPRRLTKTMQELSDIDHVRIVRFHSRVPAVLPEAVTPDLVKALKGSGKAVYVALHANHPREMTAKGREACARLIDAGITMLSQSVLLRGVNDDADILEALMRTFVETRIKPYYLHHLDPAPGTAHWRVPLEEGRTLMQELRRRLSGLAQPTYMQERPNGAGKVPIPL